MTITVIWIFLSIGLGRVQSFNPVRGASCVKVDGSVYILGGQTYTDSWVPLKYVYATGLYQMYLLSSGKKGWQKQDIGLYSSEGLYTTAAAPPEKKFFYYLRTDSLDLEKISLNSIEPSSQNSTTTRREIQVADVTTDSANSKQNLHSGQLTLIMNDEDPNELILLGAKVESSTVGSHGSNYELNSAPDSGSIPVAGSNSGSYFSSIVVFSSESNAWETFPAPFLNDKFYVLAVYKGFIYVFGPGFDTSNINIDISKADKVGSNLILAKFNIKEKTWSSVMSTGDNPGFHVNYTYTQQRQQVYLVGENDRKTGILYVLDLNFKIPKWIRIQQDGFTGYEAGCLTYYDDDLYHYFGTGNSSPVQKINIASLNLEPKVSDEGLPIINYNKYSGAKYSLIIWGSLGSSLALGLIIAAAYIIRKRQKKLRPPQIYQEFVICEPKLDLYNDYFHNTNNTDLTDTTNPSIFEINELDPKECFGRKLSSKHAPFTMSRLKESSPSDRALND